MRPMCPQKQEKISHDSIPYEIKYKICNKIIVKPNILAKLCTIGKSVKRKNSQTEKVIYGIGDAFKSNIYDRINGKLLQLSRTIKIKLT